MFIMIYFINLVYYSEIKINNLILDSPTNRSNLSEDDNFKEKHDKELNTQLINEF